MAAVARGPGNYVAWEAFALWVRAIEDTEGHSPDWLAETVERRCLGFSEFVVKHKPEHRDAKVKAHHWSTLSMKNMFGVVPGVKYGWPKNLLHWHGIQQRIADLVATVPIHFVVADATCAWKAMGRWREPPGGWIALFSPMTR